MALYSYTAKSFKGEIKSETREAKNERQLAQILRKEGYILISAESDEKTKKKEKDIFVLLKRFRRVSLTEKIFFARNLGMMISAGLSLSRSLEVLSTQAKSKKFQTALLDMGENIKGGKNFSESLANWPEIFSEFFINIVKVGEESGTLKESLDVSVKQMEKEHELKANIKQAMVYPAVIIIVMFGIAILMLVAVIPKLSKLFRDMNVNLPLTTRIVMATGDLAVKKWYLFLLAGLFLVLFFWLALKTKNGRFIKDTILLKIPLISGIIKKSNSAQTIRTLSSLISSNVPIVRSLEIISGTLGNIYYKNAVKEAAVRVKKGEKLSDVLRPHQKIYPFGTIEMLEVGEETGETSIILEKLADFFEEEVARTTKNLVSILEPILMIIIGATVGFFAISMVQPMYSMLATI